MNSKHRAVRAVRASDVEIEELAQDLVSTGITSVHELAAFVTDPKQRLSFKQGFDPFAANVTEDEQLEEAIRDKEEAQ